MSEMTREGEGEQPQAETDPSSIFDQLIIDEDVQISNSPRRKDGKKRAAKPARSPSSLTVSPPPRDNSAFFQPQQQQQPSYLSSPPPFDMSIFMPSPTAPWIKFPLVLHSPQSVDSHCLNLPNSTGGNLTPNHNVQLSAAPFDQLSPPDSDLLDSSPEYPWFPAPQNASPSASNFGPLLQLLNLSPMAVKVGERSLPDMSSYNGDMNSVAASSGMSSDAVSNQESSSRRGRSPSPTPSRLSDVSPMNSPLTSTPNSPFDSPFGSEGGYFSDGGTPIDIIGVLERSVSSSKRKTPDRALDESEETQSLDEPDTKKQ